MQKTIKIKKLSELIPVAKYICDLTKSYRHFCFDAAMGAGKTTLINEVCRQLGVKEQTSSPTYSIVNEYIGEENQSIFHFDLYRINDERELLDIGMLEILDSNTLCFIEWPEKTKSYLPEKYVEVIIEITPTHRVVKIIH